MRFKYTVTVSIWIESCEGSQNQTKTKPNNKSNDRSTKTWREKSCILFAVSVLYRFLTIEMPMIKVKFKVSTFAYRGVR